MRANRFHRIVLFGSMMIVILACNFLGNVSTPLAPSGAQLLKTPSEQVTATLLAGSTMPEAKAVQGTQTVVPSTPFQGPTIPHLARGPDI